MTPIFYPGRYSPNLRYDSYHYNEYKNKIKTYLDDDNDGTFTRRIFAYAQHLQHCAKIDEFNPKDGQPVV